MDCLGSGRPIWARREQHIPPPLVHRATFSSGELRLQLQLLRPRPRLLAANAPAMHQHQHLHLHLVYGCNPSSLLPCPLQIVYRRPAQGAWCLLSPGSKLPTHLPVCLHSPPPRQGSRLHMLSHRPASRRCLLRLGTHAEPKSPGTCRSIRTRPGL